MAELVGGAFLLSTLLVALERLASLEIINYFHRRKLKDGLLKKLLITVISINQVLEDAEERQDRNPNLKQCELKDAAFKAEDLLDEIAIEASRRKLDAEFQTSKVRGFFPAFVNPFDKGIESRIEEVLKNLEYLTKQHEIRGLKAGFSACREVGAGIDESLMYGIDVHKEEVIQILLSHNISGHQLCNYHHGNGWNRQDNRCPACIQ